MGFDGCVVPEALRPYVDWVTGMAWPEGDPQGCFRMADACVVAAHRVVADTDAANPVTAELIGERWDGAAQQAFVTHVRQTLGGRRAELVKQLIAAATALNGVGVAIQYAQRMITVIVILLLVTVPFLIWQAPWALRAFLQVTRMSALRIGKVTLTLMAFFAAFGGALDLGIQYSQVKGGRRDEIDVHQLLISARDGAINGALTGLLGGGLGRLATPALRAGMARAEATLGEELLAFLMTTAPGQALQYGIAGSATTAISLTLDGQPLDWRLILTSGTGALLGADGQNLATPHLAGRHTAEGITPDSTAGPDRPRPDHHTSLAQAAPDTPAHIPSRDRTVTPDAPARDPRADHTVPTVATRPDARTATPARHPAPPAGHTAAAPSGRATHEAGSARAVPESHVTRAVPEAVARPEGAPAREGDVHGAATVHRPADGARPAGEADGSVRRPDGDEGRRTSGGTHPARLETNPPHQQNPDARSPIDYMINQPADPPTTQIDGSEGPEVWKDGGWEEAPGTRLADVEQVTDLDLHPGFAATWPHVRAALLDTADGIRHLDDARDALTDGDVAGARAAADAAMAAAEQARHSLVVPEDVRARAEHEAVQAGRIADMAEVIQRDGLVPPETLRAIKDLGLNLEVSLYGEHHRQGGISYDSETNTLHVRQEMKWGSPGEEFAKYLNRGFADRLAERGFLAQEITDWNGLSQWSEGAARPRTDSGYADWVTKHMTPQSERFTDAQKDSLYAYRGDPTYSEINQPLRGHGELSPWAAQYVAHIDTAMLNSVIPEDVVVSRLVGADAFDRPLDRLEGTTQQALAYLSTSTNKNPPYYFHLGPKENLVKLWLRVPEGTHAAHMQGLHPAVESIVGPSSELALERGTPYLVNKVLFEDGFYKVFGTVLRQEG